MKISYRTATLFIQGDPTATAEVYAESKELLYFIVSAYLPRQEDIADVYQDVFVKALEKRSSVHDPSKLQSWLCSLAKNTAITTAKKLAQTDYLDLEDDLPSKDDPFFFLTPNLSKKESFVLQSRIVFDLRWSEIESLGGISTSTAKRLYRQALSKMKGEK